MRRHQELPPEAFVEPEEAARLVEGRQRKMLATSYGWCSAGHPDPTGDRLRLLRAYLRTKPDAAECALFWDFPSLPQHARTPEEDKTFKAGLMCMSFIYSSLLGVGVLQLPDMPERPAE